MCLSRAGLLHGCNHYLMHGAEVDQNIAMMLFDDNSGLDLLTRARGWISIENLPPVWALMDLLRAMISGNALDSLRIEIAHQFQKSFE